MEAAAGGIGRHGATFHHGKACLASLLMMHFHCGSLMLPSRLEAGGYPEQAGRAHPSDPMPARQGLRDGRDEENEGRETAWVCLGWSCHPVRAYPTRSHPQWLRLGAARAGPGWPSVTTPMAQKKTTEAIVHTSTRTSCWLALAGWFVPSGANMN